MKTYKYLALLGTALTLTACGGGSSAPDRTPDVNVTPPPPPPVQTSKPTKAVGPVSGFGSVIVNGVHYNTDNATFVINGQTGTQDDLHVGSVVTVKAKVDNDGNATAEEVDYQDDVRGEVESVDEPNHRMTVLGQTVIVDGNTSYDSQIASNSLADIHVGDVVEVSGEANANDHIVASRIDLDNASNDFNVRGTVSNLDTASHTLDINNQHIDYAQANLDNFGNSNLADGQIIVAEGTDRNNAGDFVATKLKFEGSEGRDDNSVGQENENGELHGFVTAVQDSTHFDVAGVSIITDSNTSYSHGSASDIAVNIRLEASGKYDANGALVASKIDLELDRNNDHGDSNNGGSGSGGSNDGGFVSGSGANIEIQSALDSSDTTQKTITIYGKTFSVDLSTRFEDRSSSNVRTFGLSDLTAGDYLSVTGYDRSTNDLYASKIERENNKNKDELKAFVKSKGTDSLVMIGVTVTTDANTRFEDRNENSVSAGTFFSQVKSGDLVKAEGTKTGAQTLAARKLKIDHPDNND